MKVNFIDLQKQYAEIKEEVNVAITKVLDSCAFAAGKFVKDFEEEFALKHGAKYCSAVNSGTAALHLALLAMGIGPGDEVIVPANTFFASAEAVSLVGATPLFVDCNSYYLIDVNMVETLITDKTKAIIPVHLYGQPAQMEELMAISEKYGIAVLEDCAQAHFATCNSKLVGNFGKLGCFSFYPGKNLGAYGEAGAVITDDEQLYNKIQALKDHGMSKKYHHDYVGFNYRMEGIQAAVLSVKLKYIDEWNNRRRLCAQQYLEQLKNCGDIILPKICDNIEHVWHLFVIRTSRRDELAEFLQKRQIYTGIHYPIPCHKQKAYSNLKNTSGLLSNSESWAGHLLSLPISEQHTCDDISVVTEAIREFFE